MIQCNNIKLIAANLITHFAYAKVKTADLSMLLSVSEMILCEVYMQCSVLETGLMRSKNMTLRGTGFPQRI